MLCLLSPKSLQLFGDPVRRIVSNVLPLSWLSILGTFSRKRYLGFLAAAIRAISKIAFLLCHQILFSLLRLRRTDREILRPKGRNRVTVRVQFFLRHQSKVHLLYRTLLHMPALHTYRFHSIRRTQSRLWLQVRNGNRRCLQTYQNI